MGKIQTKSQITKSKIRVELDLREQLSGLKGDAKQAVKQSIAEFTQSSLEGDMDKRRSSVQDGVYNKKLSKQYKKFKQAQGGKGSADLKLTGDMREHINYNFNGNKLIVNITESKNKKKMFNHNTGDTLPQRQVLPNNEEQNFRPGIENGILRIIREAKSDPES